MTTTSNPVTWTRPPQEGPALLDAIVALPPHAATACAGWTVHELVAHLAAGAAELADLVERRLVGRPDRPTRAFDEREQPYLALAHDVLLTRLVEENIRMLTVTSAWRSTDPGAIAFTGTTFTPDRLELHTRSEAALHRWDLVGSDDVSRRLLAQPELTEHAVSVLGAMPLLGESTRAIGERARRSRVEIRSLALTVPDGPAVVLRWVGAHASLELVDDPRADLVVALDPSDRLLALWGRRSLDVELRVVAGVDALPVLEEILWPAATPWPIRSAIIDA